MAQPEQKLLNCNHSYQPTVVVQGEKRFPGLKCRHCETVMERREVVAQYKGN